MGRDPDDLQTRLRAQEDDANISKQGGDDTLLACVCGWFGNGPIVKQTVAGGQIVEICYCPVLHSNYFKWSVSIMLIFVDT